MLTQNDVQEIKRVIQEEVGDKINLLPTKEEFFSRMDKLSGEIQKVREEQTLHQGQHDHIDVRLSRVEKKLHFQPLVD